MITKNIKKLKLLFEQSVFTIFSWWTEKIGIGTSRFRLLFIYLSFIAIGSPIIAIHFTINFFLGLKNHYKRKHIWDV